MEFLVQKDFDSVDLSAIKILIMGGGYLSPEMYDEVLRHGLILFFMIHQYMRHQYMIHQSMIHQYMIHQYMRQQYIRHQYMIHLYLGHQ